jgi:hypothetical protein
MLIQTNESGVSACDYFYIFASLGMMCLFYAAIPLGIVFIDERYLYPMITSYVIYLIWSCCHPSTRYISNLVTLDQTYRNINSAILAPPSVEFHIQCYHFETRIHTSRDSNGRHRTTTHRERVNTHRATSPFQFRLWEDRSPPSSVLHFLSVLSLSRLQTKKKILYGPEASYNFQCQKNDFIRFNNRDSQFDYSLKEEILYQSDHSLVYNGANGKAPWYTSCGILCLLDFFILGWI